jgi:hypothetical protein
MVYFRIRIITKCLYIILNATNVHANLKNSFLIVGILPHVRNAEAKRSKKKYRLLRRMCPKDPGQAFHAPMSRAPINHHHAAVQAARARITKKNKLGEDSSIPKRALY